MINFVFLCSFFILKIEKEIHEECRMRNSYGFTLEEVIELIANQREYQEDLLQRHANDDESSSQRKNEVRSRIVIPK